MIVATTTYLYADISLTQHYAQGVELVDRGPWSSSVSYAIGDVIQIGLNQYIALAANINTPPTAIIDETWSTLVVVEEQQVIPSSGSDYIARALGNEALALGNAAYSLAQTGTNVAYIAYSLAQTGTNAANTAYSLAQTGTDLANAAYALAQTGTNLGNASYSLAQTGTNLIIAESGSRITADAAIVAFVFGSIAVDLAAETGSRIAADAALQAFVFGSIGNDLAAEIVTRASSDQQIITILETGTSIANAAYSLGQTGTNIANAAYALAQLGTVIPPLSALPDVNIPAPSANQVLSFNGTVWTAEDRFNRSTTILTTGSLVALAQETGVVDLGKSFDLISVSSSGTIPFRLRLYSTSIARAADLSRPRTARPTISSQHEVITDLALNSSTGFTWILSPKAVGSNGDNPASANIYYTVENLGSITASIVANLIHIVNEY